MESSPGLVRRRIQEMTTSFQTQNSPRNSPRNSPKHQTRKKIQPPLQPSLAKGDSNKMSSTSSLSNKHSNSMSAKHFNSMSAKPFKPMYTATATATITTSKSPASNRRFYNNQKTLNDTTDGRKSNGNEKQKLNFEVKNKRVLPQPIGKEEANGDIEKIRINGNENNESSFKQRRKTTPTNILLTAPKPFKSLTNTYDSHRKPVKNLNDLGMDCTEGNNRILNKNTVSSSTLPSHMRHQQDQQHECNPFYRTSDQPDANTKEPVSSNSQEPSSPSSEPPPILPRRSSSSLKSPNKPAVPPKPRNISNKSTPSPKKSSLDLNGTSFKSSKCNNNGDNSSKMQLKISSKSSDKNKNGNLNGNDIQTEKDIDPDRFCESPINTSFTKFNQRVQKLDLLKRRQSYSEFEELIEKKRELRERMLAKISLLREEHDVLLDEKKENDNSGTRILLRLEQMAADKEVDKYRQFLEEIEHITKLTVGLTIRLSRLTKKIENKHSQLSDEMLSQEKKKRKRLVDQTEEAEFLHRNTDRRSCQVRKMLSRYLDESDLNDYDAFLSNLVKHITDLKETEQRIQLGEEQLVALNDNLQNSSSTSLPSSPPTKIH